MDVEKAVTNWLNAADLGVTAYMEVPPHRPASCISVNLAGTSEPVELTARSLVEIVCWAPDRPTARALMDACVDAARRMPDELDNFFRVSVASRYRDIDPDSGAARYHAIIETTTAD